jgi:hypothetical protein
MKRDAIGRRTTNHHPAYKQEKRKETKKSKRFKADTP